MRVLVLDGDTRAALAIVRSLGRHGVDVAVASEDQPCLAGCSRWSSTVLTYPCPRTHPLWFLNWLVFTLNSSPETMLYTCSDVTTSIVGRYRAKLPSSTRVLLPPHASLEIALDKAKTIDLARKLGVPTPASVSVAKSDIERLRCLPFGFPVALKTSQSDRPHRFVTRYARSLNELQSSLSEVLADGDTVLVQEVVTGEGTAIFALFDAGGPVVTFAHRRIHEKPPSGGVSTLCQSIEPPEDMLEHSLRLLRELGWCGVAMVEFKRSASGTPVLMEINPRYWGSLELAIRCGVDFPFLACRLMQGERPVVTQTRHGANRWVLGDLDSLIVAVRHASLVDCRAVEPLRRLWDLRYGLCCEVERIDDPRPALYEYSSWLKTSIRRVTFGLKGSGR